GELRDLGEYTGQIADASAFDDCIAVLGYRNRLPGDSLGKPLPVEINLVGRTVQRDVEIVRVLHPQLHLVFLLQQRHLARHDVRERDLQWLHLRSGSASDQQQQYKKQTKSQHDGLLSSVRRWDPASSAAGNAQQSTLLGPELGRKR